MSRSGTLVVAAGLLVMQGAAFAQEALGIKLGPGWRLYPELEFRGVYDTNFYYTSPDEETATGFLARPALGIVKEGNRFRVEGGARAEIAEFDVSNLDDYVDRNYFASGSYTLTSRHRVKARLGREEGHDPFGLRRTEIEPDLANLELDEFERDDVVLTYRFGATNARMNLEYEYRNIDKEYQTNRDLGTRFLDYERTQHTGTAYYNHSPRTALMLRGSVRDNDYPHNAAGQIPRDSREYRAQVGVSWLALSKTNAQVFIGRLEHDPKDPRRDSFTGLDWDVQIDWTPSPKTTFTLTTGRESDPSFNLAADFINTRQYIVAWQQRWAPRLHSDLSFGYYDQDFEGIPRHDKFYRTDLEATWLLTRDFALIGGLSHLERESNTPLRDFDKQVATIGFRYRR